MSRFRVALPFLAASLLLLSACNANNGSVNPPAGEESSSADVVVPLDDAGAAIIEGEESSAADVQEPVAGDEVPAVDAAPSDEAAE